MAAREMARIIDGTAISNVIREELSGRVEALRERGVTPSLTAVLVGNDPASEVYVRRKTEACEQVGMRARTLNLPMEIGREELSGVIDGLNADPEVHGILIQLPLPEHLNSKGVLARVHPQKDVDGFHPLNAGYAFVGDPRGFVPATPAGIMEILRRERVPTRGRHVVIVGRSLIVSKPLASLLMAPGPDATVTLTHKWTTDLASHTRMADILVVSVGKAGLITADMVKPGATVIDVGINRIASGGGTRIVGDVDFEAVREVAGAITPVPGGVGPMTITMLLVNTLEAALRAHAAAERRARPRRSRR
jgi:methylenetetrahydrofolate dehydrogenase (NADP+) / methenyltetrahydrofolate cyclohydrolase